MVANADSPEITSFWKSSLIDDVLLRVGEGVFGKNRADSVAPPTGGLEVGGDFGL
jgi:hypothetical protein